MYNPRFPHKLKVWRGSLDSLGNPVTDANGNPTYTLVPLSLVYTIDGEPQRDANGNLVIARTVNEIAFGYRTETRNTQIAGDVATSDFKLACPMFTTFLKFGDILEMTDYDRTYKCSVIKKTDANWGSNIYCNEIRN